MGGPGPKACRGESPTGGSCASPSWAHSAPPPQLPGRGVTGAPDPSMGTARTIPSTARKPTIQKRCAFENCALGKMFSFNLNWSCMTLSSTYWDEERDCLEIFVLQQLGYLQNRQQECLPDFDPNNSPWNRKIRGSFPKRRFLCRNKQLFFW